MKTTASSLVLAGAGLALAAPGQLSSCYVAPVLKRTSYDLAGLAYPDKHTRGREELVRAMPTHLLRRRHAPTASSRVCLEISGSHVLFSFQDLSGYTYDSASVVWSVKGNVLNPEVLDCPSPDQLHH